MKYAVEFVNPRNGQKEVKTVDAVGMSAPPKDGAVQIAIKKALAIEYGVGAGGIRLLAVRSLDGKSKMWSEEVDGPDKNVASNSAPAATSNTLSIPTIQQLTDKNRTRQDFLDLAKAFDIKGVPAGGDVDDLRQALIVHFHPESDEAKAATDPAT